MPEHFLALNLSQSFYKKKNKWRVLEGVAGEGVCDTPTPKVSTSIPTSYPKPLLPPPPHKFQNLPTKFWVEATELSQFFA